MIFPYLCDTDEKERHFSDPFIKVLLTGSSEPGNDRKRTTFAFEWNLMVSKSVSLVPQAVEFAGLFSLE
jgi:hypothetical protein